MSDKPKEKYKPVIGNHGPLELCPVCGAFPEIWQYSKDFNSGPILKVVMCSNGEAFGPQESVFSGCLLYMPPDEFYRPTIREAIKYWNQYAVALVDRRLSTPKPSDSAPNEGTAQINQP